MNITEAIRQINYAAERVHNKYITFGFGQMMVYQEKSEEATDFISRNYPEDLSDYPLLQAEVKATKRSSRNVANNIIKQRSEWVLTCAKIEEVRLEALEDLYDDEIDFHDTITRTQKLLDLI